MTDRNDEGDPLLVRPYLLGDPGGTAPPAAGPTWPEAAAEPAVAPEPADATVILPALTPAPSRPGRRRLLLVLGTVLVLVLLGAAAAVAALLPEPGVTSAGPVGAPLPAPLVSEPPPATTPAPTGTTRETTAANRTRPTSSPTATPTSTPAATGTSTAPPPATAGEPTQMLVPPPGDRVGRIHGPGGLCLDLNGGVAADNNHIQVFTCNDSPAQVWTLAADGTLRVVGRCAMAADDGTVRITGCDGRRSAQWRAGPDRALVNLASGDCLTDPGTGTRVGAGVRIEDCSGAERQRWELP
ncbi:ricin-type beta-trefoil lectin domain protein [Actinoplanes sp. NPDC049599]|uniref:ricin-type beta-trefoil lectin domain protein n=1 Tax=Actinoplanes sp. NPDC049599 TaxID=3363903 RepID=UPI0037BC9230